MPEELESLKIKVIIAFGERPASSYGWGRYRLCTNARIGPSQQASFYRMQICDFIRADR